MKQYEDRDIEALGRFYTTHLDAIEDEKLTFPSDIAAELAYRDSLIGALSEQLKISKQFYELAITQRRSSDDRADEAEKKIEKLSNFLKLLQFYMRNNKIVLPTNGNAASQRNCNND